MKKGEHHERIDGIVEYIFLFKGSQRENKKKDKRNENGEHHKRIDGIVLAALARRAI